MDGLTIDVDARALLAMFDALGDVAEQHVREAARITAGRVRDEAKARLQRQLGPQATGQTVAAITVSEDTSRPSFAVFVGPTSHPAMLPIWLEWGTRYMTARPFLFNSAKLEEGPHRRRIADAMQAAIDQVDR